MLHPIMERGFFITLQAVRRQLVAMPNDLFLLRLIHPQTRKPFPAEPLWTAFQLSRGAMVRFLRLRNREGFDVYIRPYSEKQNAGYILLDLDTAAPSTLERMRAHGHQPCVVVQTSTGHLQAWVRLSQAPLAPALATAIGQHLAHLYGGDPASTDWCHLGRLAGFTNQKPTRRQPSGYAPWVRLLHAQTQLATHGISLVQAAQRRLSPSLTQPISTPRHQPACQSQSTPPSMVPHHQAHGRRRHLSALPRPPAHPATLPPPRLEHRRLLDRQRAVPLPYTSHPGPNHPAAR